MFSTLLLCVILSLASSLEINGNTIIVHNASDFIELSNNVNNNVTSYNDTTVLLGDDIDFTGYLEDFNPVGENFDFPFRGAFDGQGHTISNLAVNSSATFVGLFGVTNGTSFRNVVVDSSCSFLSTYNFTGLHHCSVSGSSGP